MSLEADVDGVAPARGLMKNPALLREIAAACGDVSKGDLTLTSQQKIDLLERMGKESGRRRKCQGFLLKIARSMFGEESQEFVELLNDISRG